MKKFILFLSFSFFLFYVEASSILIKMDETQTNHLKAYGAVYWLLAHDLTSEWLLNYKGGSFMTDYYQEFEKELILRNVSYQIISEVEVFQIKSEIANPEVNMDIMQLEVAPKIAVYSPKSKQPWDDAVTLALTYAEIPYEVIFDDEVLQNQLPKYDWLHLHHEDFTGQYGKFYRSFGRQKWYLENVKEYERNAAKYGFEKVSHLKLAVVKKIMDFCSGGGFLFAMCSATDTYDIALAAEGVDICEVMYDHDPADPQAQSKLHFDKTFAFTNFQLFLNPYYYEYSTIDNSPDERKLMEEQDFFTLFTFSAKWDPLPTMLTQNHQRLIKGFIGQTTGFKKNLIKSNVLIMGETSEIDEAKYIHGTYGKGTWTFYAGHDPEDYKHYVGEEPTDLNLYPNSPGYRLILNNILFPASKKKKRKT